MMLGRPEWFTYRLMGWGLAPRTWQGWVYIAAFMGVWGLIRLLPLAHGVRDALSFTVLGLLVIDVISIWAQMGKHHDEREKLHQLIIERNCSVAAVFAVLAAMVYETWRNQPTAGDSIPFDPVLLGILGVMALTKLISSIWLKARM
jgi:hypothetical protein